MLLLLVWRRWKREGDVGVMRLGLGEIMFVGYCFGVLFDWFVCFVVGERC